MTQQFAPSSSLRGIPAGSLTRSLALSLARMLVGSGAERRIRRNKKRTSPEQEMKLAANAKHLEDETYDVGDECGGLGDDRRSDRKRSQDFRKFKSARTVFRIFRSRRGTDTNTDRPTLHTSEHIVAHKRAARINTRFLACLYACIRIRSLNAGSVTVRSLAAL